MVPPNLCLWVPDTQAQGLLGVKGQGYLNGTGIGGSSDGQKSNVTEESVKEMKRDVGLPYCRQGTM